jgi:hypothetical protein
VQVAFGVREAPWREVYLWLSAVMAMGVHAWCFSPSMYEGGRSALAGHTTGRSCLASLARMVLALCRPQQRLLLVTVRGIAAHRPGMRTAAVVVEASGLPRCCWMRVLLVTLTACRLFVAGLFLFQGCFGGTL